MEYNTDGMVPVGKPNPLKRLYYALTSTGYSRTLGLLLFLLIAAGIPLTTYIAQQRTQIKQQAAERLPGGGPEGSIEVFNARGDALPPNGTTSSLVQLKITAPNGSTLGQANTPPITLNTKQSFIPQVYAAGCPGVCIYVSSNKGACTYAPSGDSACSGYPSKGRTHGGGEDDSTVDDIAHCYTGSSCQGLPPSGGSGGSGGGGSSPTPTSTPTPPSSGGGSGSGSGTTIQCASVFATNPAWIGQNITVTVNYAGNPALIAFWISNNSAINKNPGEVTNEWTKIDTRDALSSGTQYTLDGQTIIKAGFLPGRHAILAELMDGDQRSLDNRVNCMDTLDLRSSAAQPTATPTGTQPTSTNSVIGINIQNLGAPGTGQSRQEGPFEIRNLDEIGRILKDGVKVGWNLYLPIFAESLTEQVKKVEVTFIFAGDKAPVRIVKEIKYAPFAMRFDSGVAGQPIRAGQKLYVITYGNEQAGNVVITSTDGTIGTIPMPAGNPARDGDQHVGVVSPVPCGPGTAAPTCAWKIPIPGDKIPTPGRYTITFRAGSDDKVTETVDILAAGAQTPNAPGQQTTTVAPLAPTVTTTPGAPTATPTVTPRVTATPTATPRPTVTPGGPTVTPTVTPTTTPIPTPTTSITPPPPGPAAVSFKVILSGIGVKTSKGSQAIVNDNPNRKKRDATLYLYEPGVDATGDFEGKKTINNGKGKIPQPEALVFDRDGKFFAANFNLGQTFTPGQYQVFIWTPGYLRRRIPSIQTFTTGTTAIRQEVALMLGDANNDNQLNLLDYREYLSCLNQHTTTCLKADFNDDGAIDKDDKHGGPSFLDHNLFTSQFAIVNGD